MPDLTQPGKRIIEHRSSHANECGELDVAFALGQLHGEGLVGELLDGGGALGTLEHEHDVLALGEGLIIDEGANLGNFVLGDFGLCLDLGDLVGILAGLDKIRNLLLHGGEGIEIESIESSKIKHILPLIGKVFQPYGLLSTSSIHWIFHSVKRLIALDRL